ncbi:MAG: Wzz/FepE/Etk N-terminal domain-containing protein, partial [Beijerinckiaceae bacterium]
MFEYGRDIAGEAPSGDRRRTRPAPSALLGLSSLPAILWRRKWPIVLLPIAFAAGAALYSSMLPDRYQSMAQVLVDPRELRVLSTDVSPQSFSSDAIAAYIESLTRVIVSTDMLQRIVEREKLTTDSEYAGRSGIQQLLGRLIPLGDRTGNSGLRAAEQLRRNLWVRRGERTFVIDIA